MPFDAKEKTITTVGAWPALNKQSIVHHDDENDDLVQHWRMSSTIEAIEAIPDPDTEQK